MKQEGPDLTILTKRLAETPKEFTLEPMVKEKGRLSGDINVGAVISDLIYDHGGNFLSPEAMTVFSLDDTLKNRNWLHILLIIAYLLHDDWFLEKKMGRVFYDLLIHQKWNELAGIVKYPQFINEPERREELARLILDILGFFPLREDEKIALDRLYTIDSVERTRLIEKTRLAQKRAKELQDALARKEAEEAASKMTRE